MNEDNPHQKSGSGMLIIGWVIALGMLAFLFSGALDRQHNPNRSVETSITESGSREIALQRNRQGHYVSNGKINGYPVTFLLDTGATLVSIPESVANRLNLKRGQAGYAETANGTITTYATLLDEVSIGGIRQRNVRADINPYFEGDEILLGMSFLKHLELVQRGDTLTLRY